MVGVDEQRQTLRPTLDTTNSSASSAQALVLAEADTTSTTMDSAWALTDDSPVANKPAQLDMLMSFRLRTNCKKMVESCSRMTDDRTMEPVEDIVEHHRWTTGCWDHLKILQDNNVDDNEPFGLVHSFVRSAIFSNR